MPTKVLLLSIALLPVSGSRLRTAVIQPQTNLFLFGVINDDGQHYQDEWRRGVRATTLELHWNQYEPQEGVYDQGYINHMKQVLAQLNAQGWFVQLVPGYQYAPDWVFTNYPDMHYINQYSDKYDPDPATSGSYRVINAPFNPHARDLISNYLARVFQDFGPDSFSSVRVGGGVQGEL
ncbi:MAG TPA: beta-galactosidase, partial [Anaerolineales bacterium]|nr:beta-galactosidase [Anaerolineales bacterium]